MNLAAHTHKLKMEKLRELGEQSMIWREHKEKPSNSTRNFGSIARGMLCFVGIGHLTKKVSPPMSKLLGRSLI